jgi:NADH-quinone oxidoreductase subunit A
MGASSMIILIIAALAFSSIAILIGKVLTKGTKNAQKGEPYECGIPTTGKTWIQLNVGYYLFALIFLVFDVELVFLYPWAVAAKLSGWVALVEIVIFFFILFIGFLYAHKKGALKWM